MLQKLYHRLKYGKIEQRMKYKYSMQYKDNKS